MTSAESRTSSLAGAGRATILLAGGALLVQVIGFIRQLFLAAEIGIDSGLDALLIALAAPQALVAILIGGVITAIVPAYAAAKDDLGVAAARRMVGTVLVWVGLAGLALSALLWQFADEVVSITGPGLEQAGTAAFAVDYLRTLAPLAFIGAVSSIFYALCQAEFLFPSLALAIVTEPLLALLIMVVYWDSAGLDGLAVGTLVGGLAGLAIVAGATAARRVTPSPHLLSRGLGLRELVGHAVPLTVSAAILQVNDVVTRAVASLLLAGGVSALRYGDSLVRAPFSAINPAYGRAIYPTLVRAARGDDQSSLGSMTERLLRYAVVFFVPIAGLTIAVAPLATAIAYDRGAYSDADLGLTARVVAVSTPLIVTWTVMPTLVSALNARRRGRVLLAAGVINVAINLVLTLVLGRALGVVGVALATAVASIVAIAYMGYQLARTETSLHLRPVIGTFARSVAATAPCALAFGIPIWLGFSGRDLAQQIGLLVATGIAGLTAYYLIAARLGLEEARSIIAFGTDTSRRLWRALRVKVAPR